jgi:hypothetical protein
MTTLRAAAQQTLEALEKYDRVSALEFLRAALAEPEQIEVLTCPACGASHEHYTHPPQRKPLTNEEIEAIRQVDDCGEDAPEFTRIFRIAERAHGIGGEA